jgi:two-component system, OmpR family, phosphate regulon sensor histidine kinase PhoR
VNKNINYKQVAVIAGAIISISIFLSGLLIVFNFDKYTQLLFIFILPVFSFVISYFTLVFFINKYIYSRIKLIYKTIHETKNIKTLNNDSNNDIIEYVNQEVIHWKASYQKELNTLNELEEYRRTYIGNVSHELKTPLFNIQGFIETLIDGGIDDPSINRKYLEKASSNIERLQVILEDLTAISKLESGQLMLDLVKFDIRELIKEVFDEFEISAKSKGVKLSFKDGADGHFTVYADREKIRQVLVNLIGNALKYGKVNGSIKVSLYELGINVLIEVTDNGLGIAQSHLKHIFDRFYRVEKGRSRENGGSGLGLSIVKHIIEAHNQTINVRSKEGFGSTFGFTLAAKG